MVDLPAPGRPVSHSTSGRWPFIAARRAGVTHAAATYHFGDRAGLLTAVAAEGYRLLAEALRGAQEIRGSFLEVGVAYVRFAVTHRAH